MMKTFHLLSIWLYFQDNKDWNNEAPMDDVDAYFEIWLYFQDNKDWNTDEQYMQIIGPADLIVFPR